MRVTYHPLICAEIHFPPSTSQVQISKSTIPSEKKNVLIRGIFNKFPNIWVMFNNYLPIKAKLILVTCLGEYKLIFVEPDANNEILF